MTIYGLTGQTGAGKTTVLQMMAEFGAFVIDCDGVYWEILAHDVGLQEELLENFGDLSSETEKIDRKKLGTMVFSDPGLLLKLNHITHPYVLKKVEENIVNAQKSGHTMVVIDAISLIESGLHHRCDVVVAVVATESSRIERIMARDGISQKYAQNRVRAQKNQEFYQENSNVVLKNDFNTAHEFSEYAKELFIKEK